MINAQPSSSLKREWHFCSFHGCIHNLALNGQIVSLDRLAAESGGENGTRLPVALCPSHIESPSVPCRCLGNWSDGCYQNQSLNACLSEPCESNSTCVPTISGYACLCPPGSTGSHCEHTDTCQLTCLHGGTCTWTGDGARCQCPAGRTGHRCETDVDECASSPCVNGATCYESGQSQQAFRAGYACLCRPSYRGVNCELTVCNDSLCGQGGRCLLDFSDLRGYRCECLPGFQGPRCQTDLRLCASSPCHGDATCINSTSTSNQYTCLCSPGFTGELIITSYKFYR